jgi:hypothetical protein
MRLMLCQPAILILLVCVVYADACSSRTSKFAMACGHLCALAIMVWQQCAILQHEQACVGHLSIAFWIVDLSWTLASSLYCTFIVFDYITHAHELKMAFTKWHLQLVQSMQFIHGRDVLRITLAISWPGLFYIAAFARY